MRPASRAGSATTREAGGASARRGSISGVWILHVDLDQFLAAVEVLRRPELAGRPVVVGGRGDPTERGVVSTASYEARAYGVGSGMPLRLAARKCPDAVFLPVDKPTYDAASAEVMATLRALRWDGDPVDVRCSAGTRRSWRYEADDPEAARRATSGRRGAGRHRAALLGRDR